ncbi:MAG: hypothetical protein ACFFCZ_23830 [Promethearchaeota archaeon]
MGEITSYKMDHRVKSPPKDKSSLIELVKTVFKESKLINISTDLDQLAFAFMSFKDWGPAPIAHFDMNFALENPDILLNKVGIFFMTVLGQGSSCYEGLYGPLPVHGYEHQLAYLFAFCVYDESLTDKRTDNEAYALFAMFFPRGMSSFIQSAYRIIEWILFRKFQKIKNINQLTGTLLKDIKDEMKFSIYYWHLLSMGVI